MSYFAEWLQSKLDEKGWRQIDLVNQAGLSRGYVSHIINHRRNPGPEFCRLIANALDLPEEIVFRQAGLLSPNTKLSDVDNELFTLITHLSEKDRKELLECLKENLDHRSSG